MNTPRLQFRSNTSHPLTSVRQRLLLVLAALIGTLLVSGLSQSQIAQAQSSGDVGRPGIVISFQGRGVCAKAWRKVSPSRYRQVRSIANGTLCTATVQLHTKGPRRRLARQPIQVFANYGARQEGEKSCYDPLSQTFFTDRFGRAKISFPWDAYGCSIALKHVTESKTGAAIRIDLGAFPGAAQRPACTLGAASNNTNQLCETNDLSGRYVISNFVTGDQTGNCADPTLDGIQVFVKRMHGTYYFRTQFGLTGAGESPYMPATAGSDSISVTDSTTGRFSYYKTISLSDITSSSAEFSYHLVTSGSADPYNPNPSCNLGYRGTAERYRLEE